MPTSRIAMAQMTAGVLKKLAVFGIVAAMVIPLAGGPAAAQQTSGAPVGGGVWSQAVLTSGADAVFCASPTSCMAVSRHGNFMSYDGSGWSTRGATPFPSPTGWWQIDCPSSNFCLATDPAGQGYTYDGTAWAEVYQKSLGGTPAISCSSAQFCMVITPTGNALTYNGSAWVQLPALPDYPAENAGSGSYGPSYWAPAISCASPSFCAVVTVGGKGYIYNGQQWEEQIVEPRPNGTEGSDKYNWVSISCPVAGYCQVVEHNGDAIAYANGAWGAPQHVVTALRHPVFVQCFSLNYCFATSSHSTFTFNGSAWAEAGAPTVQVGAPDLSSLSCPAVGFCAATAADGSVRIFRATATIKLEAASPSTTYGAEQDEWLTVELTSAVTTLAGTVTVTGPAGPVCVVRFTNLTGTCHLTPTQLLPGIAQLTANYSGGPVATPASAPLSLTVAKVPTKVSLVVSHPRIAIRSEQLVRFSVTVTPLNILDATGLVVIKLASGRSLCVVSLRPAPAFSQGSCPLSNGQLSAGTASVRASYLGTGTFAPATSAALSLLVLGAS
jgi:hypothetical protein